MDGKLLVDTIRTMTVILAGLMAGYCLRKSGRAGEGLATKVNRLALVVIQPLVICLALWSMKTPDLRTLALPLYAFLLVLLMWPVSAALSGLLPADRAGRGSFVLSSLFSNVGFTYGTFLAFVALGAQGAALGSVYCISFMPSVFTLGYYVARRYSPGREQSILGALGELVRNAETRNPVLGILAGLALSLLRVPAPSEAPFIIDIAMPTTTAAFLFAIGLGLRLSAVRTYWRECLLLHVSKMVLAPAVGLGLAAVFGYWRLPDHSLLQVAFIESAAPVAIMSVVLADLFDLNRPMAGALWLTTNVTGVLLAPVILLIARAL